MANLGNPAIVSGETAEKWLRRWDTQQELYVADREERFAVLCDVVEAALENVAEPVILDLGCGPGSLAGRLHERLPAAKVIGIDSDPLLLGLARSRYGGGISWVDADLGGPSWQDEVPATIHAAVSTTALHWLPADRLAELYRVLGTRTAPDGVLVNGDHLGFGDERLDLLAKTVREHRARRAGVQDNENWTDWWDAVLAAPELTRLAQARAARVSEPEDAALRTEHSETDPVRKTHHHGNGLTVGEHSELLRAAGFGSVAPLWQVGDDHVLVAVR